MVLLQNNKRKEKPSTQERTIKKKMKLKTGTEYTDK